MSDRVDAEQPEQSSASNEDKPKLSAVRVAEINERIRRANKDDVVEEDRKMKNPKHIQQEIRRQWELHDLNERKRCEEEGLDYERVSSLNTPADLVWKKDAAKKRKKNPNQDALVTGDYETMSLRQNERLTKLIQPDMSSYDKMKSTMGEEQFYPTADTIPDGSHYPSASGKTKLANTVQEMIKTREKVHRRRMFDPDAEISYINEKNKIFNHKLDKFYGSYTADLREDLERGTAL